MSFVDFEELNLQFGEKIWYRDGKGSIHHGNYRGGYMREALSFLFQDFTSGNQETVHLSDVQHLERG